MKKKVKKGSWYNLKALEQFTKYGINTVKKVKPIKQPKSK